MDINLDHMEIAARLRSFRESRAAGKQWIFLRYHEARRLQFELVRSACEALANLPIMTKFDLFLAG